MQRVVLICLNEYAKNALKATAERGENWRERQRATTILCFDDGMSAMEVAQFLNIHVGTALRTRRKWFETGMDSIKDLPRSGAPTKISKEQAERLVAIASAKPMSAKQLLAEHVEAGGDSVHLNTLTANLRKAGLTWKRTRYSLQKRDEARFRAAQAEIEQLRAQAADGKIMLAYADEAGFSPIHPNRCSWSPIGEPHLIDAKRGKQLNVLAALFQRKVLGDDHC